MFTKYTLLYIIISMGDDRQQVKGMVKGQFGDTIQSLPIDLTVHSKQVVGAGSVRSDMTTSQVVRIACNTDSYIEFGDDTVVANSNSIFFPAGVEVFIMPKDTTHVAIVQESVAGIATITKVGE